MKDVNQIGTRIIVAAINVHSHLGPGLLESAYQKCLCYELRQNGLRVDTEMPLPLKYGGVIMDIGYRVDMIVEGSVLVENKALERIAPVHVAQLLTYLKLTDMKLGYLLNWNVPLMKDGIRRLVHNL